MSASINTTPPPPPPPSSQLQVAAPFIKWAGGKRRLLPALHAAEPAKFDKLIEPFIGGGAYFFSTDLPGKDCLISDVNTELINAYIVVRDKVDELIVRLEELQKDTSKAEFERIRALDPTTDLGGDPVKRAGRVIYLNKTCFNGLWRENGSGKFNVPWGQRPEVTLCYPDKLRAASAKLAGVDIRNETVAQLFKRLLDEAAKGSGAGHHLLRAGTLVYLDPPYIPLTPTASFSQYSKDGFKLPQQKELAEIVEKLTDLDVSILFSNSDTPLTRETFSSLDLIQIQAPRSIAASGTKRKSVGEVLGINYPRNKMRDITKYPLALYPNAATPAKDTK